MRAIWRDYSDRKWTPNNEMKKFEELLIENGFIIQKVRETCSKTEYMTTKGDIQDIFVFNTTDKAKDRIISSLRFLLFSSFFLSPCPPAIYTTTLARSATSSRRSHRGSRDGRSSGKKNMQLLERKVGVYSRISY